MSAMAQALAKVGLADKKRAENIDKEREGFRETYFQLSSSIGDLFNRKKAFRALSDDVKAPGVKQHPEVLKFAVKNFFGMEINNFHAKANQLLVLDKIKEEMDLLEKLLNPMIKASRKLEKDWGFKRGDSDQKG